MADKINSCICLMLSVYKSFYQMVKYGHQRNHLLQDLSGLEIEISMKASETENRFSTTENSLPKTSINGSRTKWLWTKWYTDKMSLDKMVRTK